MKRAAAALLSILLAVGVVCAPPVSLAAGRGAGGKGADAVATPVAARESGALELVAPRYVEADLDLSSVPEFSGQPYVELDGNVPGFDDLAPLDQGIEVYSPLDELGRVGCATACLGPENAPTARRGDIGMIKPAGWHDDTYDILGGEPLFNRCHLIARSLSAEDANRLNLTTGTDYMNRQGMLPFEVAATEYVAETGNHVLYRTSPVFVGDELVCRGVQIEARSMEDGGKGLSFNVFCYNVQPGFSIDYATGENEFVGVSASQDARAATFVLNTKSKKYHDPDCAGVSKIHEENLLEVESTPEQLEALGYKPCGACQTG